MKPPERSVHQFRQLLLDLLERLQIHHRERGELDLIVDPKDQHKLPAVWRALHRLGYPPVQARRQGRGWACVFAWFDGLSLETATVQLGFKRGGFWEPRPAPPSTGLCVVLLGPDGVGKSTLIEGLEQTLGPLFSGRRVFHWRPGLALPIRDGDDSLAGPHAQPPRGALLSMAYLAGFFVDFCLGYAVRMRPLLTRRGLIVFDRYFPDLMVDPERYRYAGPAWLVKALWRILPRGNAVTLILTGSAEAILARKQDLSLEELRRQLPRYRELETTLASAHVVDTGGGKQATVAAAARAVIDHLARGFAEAM